MIEVSDLTKSYGDRVAIDKLNFKINKGEVVGFLGPNGAGKSTTMKIITGFMAPTSGVAKICGFDVFENPIEVKKRIGYLPENPPVYLDMYVRDYLEYVARLKSVPKNKLKSLVDRSLEKTNLGSVQKRLIQNLSKGFRQRIGIAQALVSDPEVLILDEPTVGLDPLQVSEIRNLIKELRGHHTIILSTHILPEVEATCERIIIIHQGVITAQENLSNLSVHSSQAKNTISVRLKISNQLADLTQVPFVKGAVRGDEAGLWNILLDGNEKVIEKLALECIQKNWGLLEIGQTKADLESVFMSATYNKTNSGAIK